MMRFIVGKSVQFRFLVVAVACALMYFGMRELKNAQVDVFPEFAPPRVEIQVPSVGLSAKEVEELVTIPIEDALNGVEGLDVMRSKSVQSLAAINLIFKSGTDLLQARQNRRPELADQIHPDVQDDAGDDPHSPVRQERFEIIGETQDGQNEQQLRRDDVCRNLALRDYKRHALRQ